MNIVLNKLEQLIAYKYTLFVISYLIRSNDAIPIVENSSGERFIGSSMHLCYLEDPEMGEENGIKFKTFQELIIEDIMTRFKYEADLIFFLKGECGSGIIKEAISFSNFKVKSTLISMVTLTMVKNVGKLARTV